MVLKFDIPHFRPALRGLLCAATFAIASCAPQPSAVTQGDPTATARLLAMPDAQFFAQTRLAQQISNGCASVGFNQPFYAALINQRFNTNQQVAVGSNSRAVDLELDVATRSIQARYNIEITQANLCDVGTGEIARQSAVSAVLLPA